MKAWMLHWKEKFKDLVSIYTRWDLTIWGLQDLLISELTKSTLYSLTPKKPSEHFWVCFNWNIANYSLKDWKRSIFLLWLRSMNYNVFILCKVSGKTGYFMSLNNMKNLSVSSVQSLSHVRLFATPWIIARQASLSIPNSQSLLKLMSIKLVMPSRHLILFYPLLLLPPIPPSIRVFSNELTLHMRWPKYWSFNFSISPSNEHPGLISFRMDWLDFQKIYNHKQMTPCPICIRSRNTYWHILWH